MPILRQLSWEALLPTAGIHFWSPFLFSSAQATIRSEVIGI
jgi:hypothetical protein